MIVTAGGDGAGKSWTMDLTFPLATFDSVGALLAAAARWVSSTDPILKDSRAAPGPRLSAGLPRGV